ncbi:hypothetical protein BOW53_15145 [Solemya pervernicosa gill symbiont]|uniref:Metallo-beta-lactamase domain-containing protein n=2 Tax=Gammaproteobacteria incertae sedis TaxID=118884 RepID=A0A1T2L0M6_9GAMM|nr:MBL fold metallo-hydrolase [Candidatus Reidiella endopervernicosa]OOZ38560.1 hypothetical protein BOW53_15145 [Solemya pervernicosa gill symbiont]QKQ27660.1 MBL fold metallo-hydrolase [Candidatus Reidiella endopervernicosa]
MRRSSQRLLIVVALIPFFALLGNRDEEPQTPAPIVAAPASQTTVTADISSHQSSVDFKLPYLPRSVINTKEIPNHVLKADAADSEPLPYYEIARDTFMFYGSIALTDEDNRGWNGNAGFVITNEGVVVIDSLGTPKLGERMIATIRSLTEQPIRYLIITHNHPDHSYGSVAFARLEGVTIIGHEGTIDYLESDLIDHSVNYRRELLPKDMAGFSPITPDILIGGETFSSKTIELGGEQFNIYNVDRHHSFGDLVVEQVNEKVIWISDLAFNQRTTYMADGSSEKSVRGQVWLLEKFADAKLMVPGHGSAQTAPFPMVSKTLVYMQRLRTLMSNAIENDIDMQEAIESADFKDWQETRLYEENQGSNAHFVYREMEEELF